MEMKRYDEVLASADAYIARGKPWAEVFEVRGLAREGRRRYADAVADFGRALGSHAGFSAGPAEPDLEPARLGVPFRRRTQSGPDRLRRVAALAPDQSDAPGRSRAGSHPSGPVATRSH